LEYWSIEVLSEIHTEASGWCLGHCGNMFICALSEMDQKRIWFLSAKYFEYPDMFFHYSTTPILQYSNTPVA